jgi:hypothetical protein
MSSFRFLGVDHVRRKKNPSRVLLEKAIMYNTNYFSLHSSSCVSSLDSYYLNLRIISTYLIVIINRET